MEQDQQGWLVPIHRVSFISSKQFHTCQVAMSLIYFSMFWIIHGCSMFWIIHGALAMPELCPVNQFENTTWFEHSVLQLDFKL